MYKRQVGWLFDADDSDKKRLDYCIEHRFDAIHPNYIYVTPEYVQYAHDHGVHVNVWTPDSEEDIRLSLIHISSTVKSFIV